MGLGGLGMLFTGTPLAWVVQQGWCARLWPAGLALLAWLLIFWKVHEPPQPQHAAPRESLGAAVRGFGALFLFPA